MRTTRPWVVVSLTRRSGIACGRSSVPLDWHSATAAHRSDLTRFQCADPAYAWFDEDEGVPRHELPWEFEVQQHIQSYHPPAHAPEFLLVGYDPVGLAAMIEMRVAPFDRYCFIAAVAVAHRVSGHHLAGEALDLVPHVMSKYGFASNFVVQARIDPENYAAQSAFTSSGYRFMEVDRGYQTWAREFE